MKGMLSIIQRENEERHQQWKREKQENEQLQQQLKQQKEEMQRMLSESQQENDQLQKPLKENDPVKQKMKQHLEAHSKERKHRTPAKTSIDQDRRTAVRTEAMADMIFLCGKRRRTKPDQGKQRSPHDHRSIHSGSDRLWNPTPAR